MKETKMNEFEQVTEPEIIEIVKTDVVYAVVQQRTDGTWARVTGWSHTVAEVEYFYGQRVAMQASYAEPRLVRVIKRVVTDAVIEL